MSTHRKNLRQRQRDTYQEEKRRRFYTTVGEKQEGHIFVSYVDVCWVQLRIIS